MKEIYSKEIDYSGNKTQTVIGYQDDNNKEISPAWGYYSPNPAYKKLKRIAKKLNYQLK
jgi:hypothetical protein